jgi:hypothetical protein
MRQALEKLNEFYETFKTLNNPECKFIASYTNYILRDYRRGNHRNLKISINLLTLHHESGTNTYADFLLFLFSFFLIFIKRFTKQSFIYCVKYLYFYNV